MGRKTSYHNNHNSVNSALQYIVAQHAISIRIVPCKLTYSTSNAGLWLISTILPHLSDKLTTFSYIKLICNVQPTICSLAISLLFQHVTHDETMPFTAHNSTQCTVPIIPYSQLKFYHEQFDFNESIMLQQISKHKQQANDKTGHVYHSSAHKNGRWNTTNKH